MYKMFALEVWNVYCDNGKYLLWFGYWFGRHSAAWPLFEPLNFYMLYWLGKHNMYLFFMAVYPSYPNDRGIFDGFIFVMIPSRCCVILRLCITQILLCDIKAVHNTPIDINLDFIWGTWKMTANDLKLIIYNIYLKIRHICWWPGHDECHKTSLMI